MFREITLRTESRNQLIDITAQVKEVVRASGVEEGICLVFAPHTTAAITVNEAADPSVAQDITETLSKLVPPNAGYRHLEGNADSHVKSATVGPGVCLIIHRGQLMLGTWQGVFFCEFDGPRTRRVWVKIVPG